MKNNKLILGLLSGVAIGVVAGLLFAPHKGSRTRKRMLRSGANAADQMKNKAQDMLETVEGKYIDTIQTAEQKIKKLIASIPEINK
ncbi:MAG: YtxH domain-containing protein [Bacteroidetes bacterium]|nr:YtxH domain-containing protein [Bacteroidota bacterium]MBK8345200.1 YtxH domain-containing protein [Bacteroidota bacterium]